MRHPLFVSLYNPAMQASSPPEPFTRLYILLALYIAVTLAYQLAGSAALIHSFFDPNGM